MSYNFYKVLHLTGIFMIILAVGGVLLQRMKEQGPKFAEKKWIMMLHGIGMLAAFVGGFGLIARLNIPAPWPIWVWLKMLIWLVLGLSPMLFLRKSIISHKANWLFVIFLTVFAAYLANFKPGL